MRLSRISASTDIKAGTKWSTIVGEALTLSLVIVDIGADSKPALRFRRGFNRRDLHGEPAVFTVGTAQSQLELKGCEALNPVSHGLPRSPKIFSIDGRRPLLLETLSIGAGRKGLPGVLIPLPIEPRDASGRCCGPCDLRDIVNNRSWEGHKQLSGLFL